MPLDIKAKSTVTSIEKQSVYILSTFVMEPSQEYIEFWFSHFGIECQIRFSPYNQLFEEFINESSFLHLNTSGVNVLLLRWEDLLRDCDTFKEIEKEKLLQNHYQILIEGIKKLANPTSLLVISCPFLTEIPDSKDRSSMFIQKLYQSLESDLQDLKIKYLSAEKVVSSYQIKSIFDIEHGLVAHVPFTDQTYAALGTIIARRVVTSQHQVIKAIILDCDNTLWEGICGEEKVTITPNHRYFQSMLLEKQKEGFLLLLSSKNNEEDVWNVFDNHPDMVLKRDHIVDYAINWKSKSQNIREMAIRLNLGLESFMFIDDNQVECLEVTVEIPDVFTVRMPELNNFIPYFAEHLWLLDKFLITSEDKIRSDMYIAERKRRINKLRCYNRSDYLAHLNIEVNITRTSNQELLRTSQLTFRTNQFNTSKQQRTEQQLRELLANDQFHVWSVSVKDSYGNYGLIGTVILQVINETLIIDSFLLSCRVLNKGVEEAVLESLVEYGKKHNLHFIKFNFIETTRNIPAKDFLIRSGFKTKTNEMGYYLEIDEVCLENTHVKIHFTPNEKSLDEEKQIIQKVEHQPQTHSFWNNKMVTSVLKTDTTELNDIYYWVDQDYGTAKCHHHLFFLPLKLSTAEILVKECVNLVDIPDPTEYNYLNNLEHGILSMCKSLLSVENASLDDSFFDLGGTSLQAIRLIAEINRRFQLQLTFIDLFQKPTIREFIREMIPVNPLNKSLVRKDELPTYMELTPEQLNIYVEYMLRQRSIQYNIPYQITITGEFSIERLQKSLYSLIERHELLRTCFIYRNNKPFQVLEKDASLPLEVWKEISDSIIDNFVRPFDLEVAPLFRAAIYVQPKESVLFLDFHHIIADERSVEIFVTDLFNLYHNYPSTALELSYRDYALWRNESKNIKKYWEEQLSGELPRLQLPYSAERSESERGNLYTFFIDEKEYNLLKNTSYRCQCTPYIILLTLFSLLLKRFTNEKDMIIGTPYYGRDDVRLQSVIGMFVRSLPLRIVINENETFINEINKVKTLFLSSVQHCDFSVEELRHYLKLDREPGRNLLFDAFFSMQMAETIVLNFQNQYIQAKKYQPNFAKFDLTLDAVESQNGLLMTFEYKTPLIAEDTIISMKNYYIQMLQQVFRNPNIFMKDLGPTQNINLQHVNPINYNTHQSIVDIFESRVHQYPDRVALVMNGASMTYDELNRKANQLTEYLIEKKVYKQQDIIGIMLDRSFEMFIGIIAVLKCNLAYLPIDPELPDERITFMMLECESDFIITNNKYLDRARSLAKNACVVQHSDLNFLNQENKSLKVLSNRLAYVIFTSGTTGRPKGVMIEHRSIVNMAYGEAEFIFDNVKEHRRIAFTSSFVFDESVAFIFTSLMFGSSLYIVPEQIKKNTNLFINFLSKHEIDILGGTPTFLKLYLLSMQMTNHYPRIKKFLVGGESLSTSLVNQFFTYYDSKVVELINIYGPSECCADVTYYPIGGSYQGQVTIPIGKPLPNHTLLILDENKRPVPIGVPGELYVGGLGLARGYINRQDLTDEKFLTHPLDAKTRIYRTGDLVKQRSDGNIEFLGRSDDQLKIRGYRIELEEIKSMLLDCKGVENAVIYPRDINNSTTLYAYITGNHRLDYQTLMNELRNSLPEYMIPAQIIQVEELPVNLSGKIDKNELLKKQNIIINNSTEEQPTTKKQKMLAQLWSQVLGIAAVSLNDNFFLLGGDSIKGIQLSALLREHGYAMDVMDLFKYPTISLFESAIKEDTTQIKQNEVIGASYLTPIQKWFFKQEFKYQNQWNLDMLLLSHLPLDTQIIQTVLDMLVKHHDAFRLRFVSKDNEIKAMYQSIDESIMYSFHRRIEDSSRKILDILAEEKETANIDIINGPLLTVTHLSVEHKEYVYFIAHHLIIDAVSWRILLNDFTNLYEQCIRKEKPLHLPLKTHSFLEWAKMLYSYQPSNEELEYWSDRVNYEKFFPARGTNSDSLHSKLTFPLALETEINKVCRLLNVQVNHMFLTAVGRAIAKWLAKEQVVISLESHGRYMNGSNLNIERTLGWFTSEYPFIMSNMLSNQIETSVLSIKNELDAIPNYGLGYGVLYSENEFYPEIGMNFLGDLRHHSKINNTRFQAWIMKSGLISMTDEKRTNSLNIDIWIDDKGFHFSLDIDGRANELYTLSILERYLVTELHAIIKVGFKRQLHVIDPIFPYNEVFVRDCFYHALIPALRHFRKTELSFLLNDLYQYHYSDSGLEVRYKTGLSLEQLMKEQGLMLLREWGMYPNKENIKTCIDRGQPVIVAVDSYYLPNRKDTYRIKHWSHTLLIYGYDEDKALFYTIEQHSSDTMTYKERLISYEYLLDSIKYYSNTFAEVGVYPVNYAITCVDSSKSLDIDQIIFCFKERWIQNKDCFVTSCNLLLLLGEELNGEYNEVRVKAILDFIQKVNIEKQLDRYKWPHILSDVPLLFMQHLDELIITLGNIRTILQKSLIRKRFSNTSKKLLNEKISLLHQLEVDSVRILEPYVKLV